ncbi:putative caffeoyl-CoA O-methyltransferase 2 [Saccoglossus kowalevskii]|uniref:Probable caffeoyl-CoA O-methyltransferase 2-like n=1 Tax=Saccoglossus kowalevskii TaxID=10224 RepID=A0ABM0GYV6_SACKO|nr:PREDICTED: probable caffeoyl-CoA O-methyltransferase 2-like [Saccoglossus kowalevskii]
MLLDNKGLVFAGTVSIGVAIGVGYIAGYKYADKMRPPVSVFKESYLAEDNPILNYVIDHSLREPVILKDLRETTVSTFSMNRMLIAPEEAQFFRILLKMLDAKKVIEIGVFTGYNTLSMALTLPDDGKVIACDVCEKFTNFAEQYWSKSEINHKIDLRLQPALKTLDSLIEAGESGTYDFIFIDADKDNYSNYYDRAYTLLRKGGIIAIDNVIWKGKVADKMETDIATTAIRACTDKIYSDQNVDISMLTLGDGVMLAMKK